MSATGGQLARQQAIRQIERKRHFWIIYPAIAWVLITAGDAWRTSGRKPISESEIQREVDRQASLRH